MRDLNAWCCGREDDRLFHPGSAVSYYQSDAFTRILRYVQPTTVLQHEGEPGTLSLTFKSIQTLNPPLAAETTAIDKPMSGQTVNGQ
jgi:hypothetical protein